MRFLFLLGDALAAPILFAFLDAILLAKVVDSIIFMEEFRLNGGRMNSKLVEDGFDITADSAKVSVDIHRDVNAGDDHSIHQIPDVQIVNTQHSFHSVYLCLDLGETDILWRALKQNSAALADCFES